ncbi:MAG TPA: hypothetical protein VGL11_04075 [Candidatus Binatia bacterium]|jgi:hypothetical protein
MKRTIYSGLLSIGAVVTLSFTWVLGHDDKPQAQPGQTESQPAPDRAASRPQGEAMKADPAAAFAALIASVMSSKDAIEVELPQSPDLMQFVTKTPKGRYLVKQLTLTKGDEVRAVSIALHSPDDIFLIRGKEVANAFEGMYYVVDRSGWLRGAAFQEGKTVTEVPMGDVWQAYEGEKAFWVWLAGQMGGPAKAGR